MGGPGGGGARTGAGAKGKAAHLHLLDGTFRKDRHGKEGTPEPSKEKPVAPSHLNERAVFHFNRIVELLGDRASSTFVDIIALLAITAEDVERYYQIIYETPCFKTVDSFGNDILKNHPLSVPYKEAKRHQHTLLAEVGLTPSSIGRTGGDKGKGKPSNPWDDL